MSFIMLTLLLISTILQSATTQPVTAKKLDFCTDVGPIHLKFEEDQVSGHYKIILPQKNISGQLNLKWHNNYLSGSWNDPDGKGPIVIVFHDDTQALTALYTSTHKPLSWSSVWQGKQMKEGATQCP